METEEGLQVAADLELCDPGQVHSLPQLSLCLSAMVVTATFNESLPRVPPHCIKLFTRAIAAHPHSNLVK